MGFTPPIWQRESNRGYSTCPLRVSVAIFGPRSVIDTAAILVRKFVEVSVAISSRRSMEDTLDILVRKFVEISVAILSRRLIEDTLAILIRKFVEVSLEVAILDGKSVKHRSKIPSPF